MVTPPSIFSRYHGLPTVVVGDRSSLALRPPPPVETYPDSILHTVRVGETLDQLAATYYSREDLWWRIADANAARVAMDLRPGEVLVIPPPRVATRAMGR